MARLKEYASAAEKQKAYRERKRNDKPVTNECPYCHSADFIDCTGKVRHFSMFEQSQQGRVYLCLDCNAYVTIDQQQQPIMWNIMVRPNLAGFKGHQS